MSPDNTPEHVTNPSPLLLAQISAAVDALLVGDEMKLDLSTGEVNAVVQGWKKAKDLPLPKDVMDHQSCCRRARERIAVALSMYAAGAGGLAEWIAAGGAASEIADYNNAAAALKRAILDYYLSLS